MHKETFLSLIKTVFAWKIKGMNKEAYIISELPPILESLIGREATTYSRGVRSLVGCQGDVGDSPCDAL